MVAHLNFSYVQHYGTMMIRSIGIYLRLTNGCPSVFVRGQGLANGANNISLYDFIKVIFIGEDEFLIFHPLIVRNGQASKSIHSFMGPGNLDRYNAVLKFSKFWENLNSGVYSLKDSRDRYFVILFTSQKGVYSKVFLLPNSILIPDLLSEIQMVRLIHGKLARRPFLLQGS